MNSIVGNKLKTALESLQRTIDESRRAREDVLTAWEEHDYEWLVAAGYLTQNDVESL